MPLKFGIKPLDELLGGIKLGNILLMVGDRHAAGMLHALAVRSQLPEEEGGLGSTVLWLDGGNAFNPYVIAELSKALGLDPERVLDRIYISRAFTCYQMSSLVLERLWGAVERFGTRLVAISDLLYPYEESDIPKREAAKAFSPVLDELVDSRRREIVLAVANAEGLTSRTGTGLRDKLEAIADLVLRLRDRRGGVEVRLEKHPTGKTGKILLSTEILGSATLEDYLGGDEDG